jgi:hypothetical protein
VGDYRNRGRGEGGLLELRVEVGKSNFPLAQGVFEMHGACPSLGGLGKLAQIGNLGQVEVGQVVDQVCVNVLGDQRFAPRIAIYSPFWETPALGKPMGLRRQSDEQIWWQAHGTRPMAETSLSADTGSVFDGLDRKV